MAGTNLTIYVVDDDAAVRDSMRVILESYDMKVVDYDSARAFLADPNPKTDNACLVLDHNMPDMNGIELIDALRAAHVPIPIVMVSGRSNSRLKEQAVRAGAAVTLDKPVSDVDLLSSIKLALASADPAQH